jgi:glycosyltransferase involved in cell wall biosynthesis
MDLCAEALVECLRDEHAGSVVASLVRPSMIRRATRIASQGLNVDRFLNRFRDYPRFVRGIRSQHDVFHVADHSYAQLVHELPAGRAGVFCHDLDAFRCVLGQERRPRWFRAMTRRILSGLEKAALVFCTTTIVRKQLSTIVEPARVVHVPLGVASDFTPGPGASGARFVLHVGSCIDRKRIDVLLAVFAELRNGDSELSLIQVGGTFSSIQRDLIRRHGLERAVEQRRGLSRKELASLYRGAALVLQPSEREGFGLPLIEALACGSIVLASDIEVFREVGGEALVYAPVGDVAAWTAAARRLLSDRSSAPALEHRLARASRYTWSEHARIVLAAYERIA